MFGVTVMMVGVCVCVCVCVQKLSTDLMPKIFYRNVDRFYTLCTVFLIYLAYIIGYFTERFAYTPPVFQFFVSHGPLLLGYLILGFTHHT
jgi:hypothetical protein